MLGECVPRVWCAFPGGMCMPGGIHAQGGACPEGVCAQRVCVPGGEHACHTCPPPGQNDKLRLRAVIIFLSCYK